VEPFETGSGFRNRMLRVEVTVTVTGGAGTFGVLMFSYQPYM
jgi:hypothetical protein